MLFYCASDHPDQCVRVILIGGFKYVGINVLGGNNILAIYSSCAGLLSLILELVAFDPNAFRSGSGQADLRS